MIKANDFAGIITRLEAELPRIESRYGMESLEVAFVLDSMVNAHRRTQRMRVEHRELAARAVAIKEKRLGPDHPAVARSLMHLALAYRFTESLNEASPYYDRAIEILETSLGPDHLELARLLTFQSSLLRYLGETERARASASRAISITEQQLGPDHPDVGFRLRSLASVEVAAGNYREARDLLQRCLAITEVHRGPDHPRTAAVLNNLGIVLRDLGEYDDARSVGERALRIREKVYGPDSPWVAQSLVNLARVLVDTRDFSEAESLYERALDIRRDTYGAQHSIYAGTLLSLAGVRSYMGEYEAALVLEEEVLAIEEKVYGPDHPETAAALMNLGSTHLRLQDLDRAQSLFTRAVEILSSELPPDHPEVTRARYNLAIALRASGRLDESQELFEDVTAVQARTLGAGHPRRGRALVNYSIVLADGHDPEAALAVALEGEAVIREHLKTTARGLPERQALTYAEDHGTGLDVALSLVGEGRVRDPDRINEVWDRLIRSRAIVLDEIATRQRLARAVDDPEIGARVDDLRGARERLARLTIRGPGGIPPEEYFQELELARRDKEARERDLAEQSRDLRDLLGDESVGLEAVAGSLPPGSALVAFALYTPRPSSWTGSPREAYLLDPHYLAFVLRGRGEEASVVALGRAEEISDLVARWRREVTRPTAARSQHPAGVDRGVTRQRAVTDTTLRRYRSAGDALRERIWDPLTPLVQDMDPLYVVPAGALHMVSFAVLPTDDDTYLVETGPLMHYLSTERRLAAAPGRPRSGRGLLALGGTDFDAAAAEATVGGSGSSGNLLAYGGAFSDRPDLTRSVPACSEFDSLHFEPLPGTETEAHEVMSLWQLARVGVRPAAEGPDQSGSGTRAETARLLAGSEANEAAFKAYAPHHRFLHLATHGFFLSGQCAQRSRSPSHGGGGWVGELDPQRNPLLLAGLALAGANVRHLIGPDEEDGILTAEEIVTLDLSGVEWAVLSACDTGLGKIRVGEGVFGLRRAFEIAGARTLIMSLWAVNDEMTRQWMTALYSARFLEGHSSAEAVRQASLQLLARQRERGYSTHPYYWGAFVAAGDWR